MYCKYYSQGIVVFLVSNAHVDSKLLTDYYWVKHSYLCPITLKIKNKNIV